MTASLGMCDPGRAEPRADWPAWRGDGTGVLADGQAPVRWDAEQNVRWKCRVPGFGHSSPITAGGRVFLTTAIETELENTHKPYCLVGVILLTLVAGVWYARVSRVRHRRREQGRPPGVWIAWLGPLVPLGIGSCLVPSLIDVPVPVSSREVLCVDAKDGKVLWQTRCACGELVGLTALTSAASPTPVTDGEYVYAHFGAEGTYCLACEDGRIIWANTDPTPHMHYKAASSPVLWSDLVIVTHDTDTEVYTVALDARTGEQRWKADRPIARHGRRGMADAYATPILVDAGGQTQLIHYGFCYLAAYDPQTGRELWAIETEAEQIVTSPAASQGFVVIAGECNHPVHIAAVRVAEMSEASEQANPSRVIWEDHRLVPCVSSPVIVDGCICGVTNGGIAFCRRLTTGEILWRHRLAGTFYASVTAAGGRLYFTNTDGITTVMAAGSEPVVLAENDLGEPVFASPALVGDSIFVRGGEHLFCLSSTR